MYAKMHITLRGPVRARPPGLNSGVVVGTLPPIWSHLCCSYGTIQD